MLPLAKSNMAQSLLHSALRIFLHHHPAITLNQRGKVLASILHVKMTAYYGSLSYAIAFSHCQLKEVGAAGLIVEVAPQKRDNSIECSGVLDEKEVSSLEEFQPCPWNLLLHRLEIRGRCNPIVPAPAEVHRHP